MQQYPDGVDIEPETVEQKFLETPRGGYCFEHSSYLLYVLRHLGFRVFPLLGRSRRTPPEMHTPLIHLFMRVEIEEKLWIVDVAMGHQSSLVPVELVEDVIQATPFENCRFIREYSTDDFGYVVIKWVRQVEVVGVWSDQYDFTEDRSYPVDWKALNFAVSTMPCSKFVHNVIAAFPTESDRYTLLNRVFKIWHKDDTCTVVHVSDYSHLISILQEKFHTSLPLDSFTYFGIAVGVGLNYTLSCSPWSSQLQFYFFVFVCVFV